MAQAYTAPDWNNGAGISVSNLQSISNVLEQIVQGEDRAIHRINIDGTNIIVTYVDGTVETFEAANIRGISESTVIHNAETNEWIYRIVYTDGTESTLTIKDGTDGNGIIGILEIPDPTIPINVKKYRILFTDGTHFDYEVKDGINGRNGQDGVGITNITESKEDNIHTITIYMSNGAALEFEIADGINTEEAAEVIEARGEYQSLKQRLDTSDSKVLGLKEDLNQTKEDLSKLALGYEYSINPLWTNGKYIVPTSGNEESYGGWCASDYIDITDATKLIVYNTTGYGNEGNKGYNAFYDEDKKYISQMYVRDGDVSIPTKAKYIRMSKLVSASITIVKYISSIKQIVEDMKDKADMSIISTISGNQKFTIDITWLNDGKYINPNTGTLQPYGGWTTSDYVDIEGVFTLNVTKTVGISDSNKEYNAFYNADKQYISGLKVTDGLHSIPSGSRYVRFSKPSTTSISVEPSIITPITNYELINSMSDNSIVALNREVANYTIQSSATMPINQMASNKPLSFIHISDIHTEQNNWNRMVEYMNEFGVYIDFALHTGDYCNANVEQYVDLYANMPTTQKTILNCVGNHDVVNASNVKVSQKTAHDLLFNHADNWNVTFMSGDNSMTYYKDFPSSLIRLIVLDDYYEIETQRSWLTARLNEAKSLGYHVITASHQATGNTINNQLDCTFSALHGDETDPTTNWGVVIKTFKENGGVHICHLCGHDHQDAIGYDSNNILNVIVENGGLYNGWTPAKRVVGTKSQDCFNVFSVNTTEGTFGIVRIGNNSDCYLRNKNVIRYDYINSRVEVNF